MKEGKTGFNDMEQNFYELVGGWWVNGFTFVNEKVILQFAISFNSINKIYYHEKKYSYFNNNLSFILIRYKLIR